MYRLKALNNKFMCQIEVFLIDECQVSSIQKKYAVIFYIYIYVYL